MIIQKHPNTSGAYPAPQSWNSSVPPDGYAVIPDTIDLSDFYAYNGFVTLAIEAIEYTRQVEQIVTVEKTRQVEKVRVVEKTREVEVTVPVEKTRTVEKTREVIETYFNEETGEEESKIVEEVYYEDETYFEDETHTETETYYEDEIYYEDETYYEDEIHLVDEVYTIDTVTSYTPNIEAWEEWKASQPEPEPVVPEPTTEERVTALEEQLAMTDETAIYLFEAQAAQEEVNNAQDEALIALFEMIGGE